MRQRVLITGGLGYLGGRIAAYLQNLGDYEVVLGSRKAQESPIWLEGAVVAPMDFLINDSLDKACQGVDVIVHLAALNHIECAENSEQALRINTLGTIKLLAAAERANVKRFIYFSTAHIYASPLLGDISEAILPRPSHPYSLTHKAAEDYVLAARDNGGGVGIVLRLSNAFGFPMDAGVNCWSLLVNDLCRQVVCYRSLKLHSMGQQRRDFVTLGNVQRVVEHFICLEESMVGNGVFNVGGDWSPRVIEMVEKIQSRCAVVLGFLPEIILPKNMEKGVSKSFYYDIGKLTNTGFDLEDDVNREIDTLLLFCKERFGSLG